MCGFVFGSGSDDGVLGSGFGLRKRVWWVCWLGKRYGSKEGGGGDDDNDDGDEINEIESRRTEKRVMGMRIKMLFLLSLVVVVVKGVVVNGE